MARLNEGEGSLPGGNQTQPTHPIGTNPTNLTTQQNKVYDPYDLDKNGVLDTSELFAKMLDQQGIDDGSSGGFSGRPLSEELAMLREQFGLDETEKLNLMREQAKIDDARNGTNNAFEIEKMVKQYELSGAQELELLGQKSKLDLGNELEVMKQKAVIDHGENEANRLFTKVENATDREWKQLESEKDRTFQKENAAEDRVWKEKQQGLDNEFNLKLKTMDIGAQTALQAARLAADQAMQNQSLSMQDKIAAANRAADEKLAVLKINADEKMQLKDLTMKEALTKMEIGSREKIAKEDRQAQKEAQAAEFAQQDKIKKQDLEAQRSKDFVDLVGKDPVRAVLLSMGVSGPILPGGDQYEGLTPMKGAEQYKINTESALNAIEGATNGGAQIGAQGVSGLNNIEKSARSFVQGNQANQILQTSAQGVGTPDRGGVGAEEVVSRALAVTPHGYETRRAAGGADIQPNTTYLTGEGQFNQGTKPEAITVGPDRRLQNIVPLTAPNEMVSPPAPSMLPPRRVFNRGQGQGNSYGHVLPAINPANPRYAAATMPPQAQMPIEYGITQGPESLAGRNAMGTRGLPPLKTMAPDSTNYLPVVDQATGKIKGWKPKDGRDIMFTTHPVTGQTIGGMNGKPNIDVSKLGPDIIAKLMQIANNPAHPNMAVAKNKLAEILPRVNTGNGVQRNNNAAFSLAGLMTR